MDPRNFWDLFLETGAPEAYLMYSAQLRSEEYRVYDGKGHCPESHGLQ